MKNILLTCAITAALPQTASAGVVQLSNPSQFGSSAVHLTFDDLLAGTLVSTQYEQIGVSFGGPITFTLPNSQVQITTSTVGAVIGPTQLGHAITNSPPNALAGIQTCDGSCQARVSPFPISFAQAVRRVGMYVGNASGPVTLTAFDAHHIAIGSATVPGSLDVTTFLGLDAGSNIIASVVLSNFSENFFLAPVLDDLFFEAPSTTNQQLSIFNAASHASTTLVSFCQSSSSGSCQQVGAAPLALSSTSTFSPRIDGFLNGVYSAVLASCSITGLCDSDGDRVPDAFDNCPGWPNPAQACCDPATFRFACTMPSAFRTYWVGELGCSADPTKSGYTCAFGQPTAPPQTIGDCTVMQFSAGTLATRDAVYGPVSQVAGADACLTSFVQPPPPITLTVASGTGRLPQRYSVDIFDGPPNAQLQLIATITNRSATPVSISTFTDVVLQLNGVLVMPLRSVGFSEGPLPVTSLTPRAFSADWDEGPLSIASEDLQVLQPQASVQFPVTLFGKITNPSHLPTTERVFAPTGPAYYVFGFTYSYTGPDSDGQTSFPNVYHGTVSAPPLTVEVSQ